MRLMMIVDHGLCQAKLWLSLVFFLACRCRVFPVAPSPSPSPSPVVVVAKAIIGNQREKSFVESC